MTFSCFVMASLDTLSLSSPKTCNLLIFWNGEAKRRFIVQGRKTARLTFSTLLHTVTNINEFQVHLLFRSLPKAKPFHIFAGFEHRIFAVDRTGFLSATTFNRWLIALCPGRNIIFHRFQPLAFAKPDIYQVSIFAISHVRTSLSFFVDSKSNLCKLMNNLYNTQFDNIFAQLFAVQDSRLKTARAK